MTKRSLLQSFDWRTLVEARASSSRACAAWRWPQTATIFPGTPWTAGHRRSARRRSTASARAGASRPTSTPHVLSPNYPDITDALITSAHDRGPAVIPWTINDQATMDVARRPRRRRHHHRLPRPPARRDGRASGIDLPRADRVAVRRRGAPRRRARYRPENTLARSRYGLDAGVDTLELDTGVTAGRRARRRCTTARSTARTAPTPRRPRRRPEYPYVGRPRSAT